MTTALSMMPIVYPGRLQQLEGAVSTLRGSYLFQQPRQRALFSLVTHHRPSSYSVAFPQGHYGHPRMAYRTSTSLFQRLTRYAPTSLPSTDSSPTPQASPDGSPKFHLFSGTLLPPPPALFPAALVPAICILPRRALQTREANTPSVPVQGFVHEVLEVSFRPQYASSVLSVPYVHTLLLVYDTLPRI
ncbi:hypothetical protein BKA70DRAFT_1449237 [Coprinopsis sp. MPI-PUGE-AT-0042]|nr:hypothetical protein BKA70DRAFT_1449237 [Coprinopsis sp. MPI-PUGE-AT-0042]